MKSGIYKIETKEKQLVDLLGHLKIIMKYEIY